MWPLNEQDKHTADWRLLHTISMIMRMAGMLRMKAMSTLTVTLAASPRRLLPPWEWGELVSVLTLDGKSAMTTEVVCFRNSHTNS